MHVLTVNCTLKPSPETSHTDALLDKIEGLYGEEGATVERIRFADLDIKTGIAYEIDGDDWPDLFAKIQGCQILLVGTPIWMGVRGSQTQLFIERLNGSSGQSNELGQFPLYNKVAACAVTGNEDGAHDAASTTLFNLTHLGATVPPNADSYWVGDAGPGNSYREANADRALYVNRTARMLVKNTVALARALAKTPIETDINAIEEAAKKVSDTGFNIRYAAP